jgi:predicted nucleic acid-binding Zn ribbon protein
MGNPRPKDASRFPGGAGGKPKRNLTSVQTILAAALKKFGLDDEIARYEFVNHWSEIVGEEISRRTRPECLRNGHLVVRVCDSSWAQELSFQKDAILKRLKRFTSQSEVIDDIYFYVGDVAGGRSR